MDTEYNDGFSYLEALKQSARPETAIAAPTLAPSGSPVPERPSDTVPPADGLQLLLDADEKRRSPRYKCEGSAEMREDGRDVGTWAAFTDISLHGCYVEAMATYPVGTVLHIKLDAKGFQVRIKGNVRVSYPYLGMGIAFTEIADEDRARLKDLLRSLSQPSVIMGPGISSSLSQGGRTESVPVISDPVAAVRAVVEYFDGRSMLMRDEFLQILRNSQKMAAGR